jgi:hypothetical protein
VAQLRRNPLNTTIGTEQLRQRSKAAFLTALTAEFGQRILQVHRYLPFGDHDHRLAALP